MSDSEMANLSKRLDLVEHSVAELCGLVALSLPPRHKNKDKLEAELTVIFDRHFREGDLTENPTDGKNPATSS